MEFNQSKIEALRGLLEGKSQVTVVSHSNPDGDAIGSGIAWTLFLRSLGHAVKFVVPNNYPPFLGWMAGIDRVSVYKNHEEALQVFIAESDTIFCVDFNQPDRLEGLGEAILANTMASKVLIDHHQTPPPLYDITFSEISASSTASLVYALIGALGARESLDYPMAEALYVGIMTDTGNFSFGNLNTELFEMVSFLLKCGIDIPQINSAVYNNFSEDRMRLLGYVLDRKMTLIDPYCAAYLCLTQEEVHRYNFKQGDSEGFVNYPLSIKHIRISAFFLETPYCIKVSLRSQGSYDMNVFARNYFNGGGHINASGGKSFASMEETVRIFQRGLEEQFGLRGACALPPTEQLASLEACALPPTEQLASLEVCAPAPKQPERDGK